MVKFFYILANVLILGGFGMLCQPFSAALYSLGFPIVVAGVATHIVLDHVPQSNEEDV